MPQKTNLNVAPYYDDFDAKKNFYKVLFRPGYSIQTRELTSLQSILQNQIESYGRFLFKQGQQVIPGEVGLNTNLDYVKLSSVSEVAVSEGGKIVYKKYDIKQLIGVDLKGLNSGVVGRVVGAEYGSEIESDTLFVKYTTSGDANNEKTFRQGETLEVVNGVNTPLLVVGTDGSVLPTSINVTDPVTDIVETLQSPAMGFCTAVEVQEGVYFVNGFFVRNDKQLLIIDKYYNKASAKVGFTIKEDLVTPEEDVSLYDNARGYSNSSAPGAHRLSISLNLVKFGYKANTDKNFIQLLQVNKGIVEKQVKAADYTLLEETLARRTYDESGDYVVEDFTFDVREYYQKSGNNGVYKLNTTTGLVGQFPEIEADEKLVLNVSSGKAYVKGFEIVNKETKSLTLQKGRDTLSRDNVTLKSKGLPEFNITNVYGTVPLNTVGDELTGYPTVTLNSVFNDGTIGFNGLESSNYYRSTIDRRSTSFKLSQAIKTIYVAVLAEQPTDVSQLPNTVWFVTQRGTGITEGKSATVIGKGIVNRPEVNPATNAVYAELTLLGDKGVLDKFLTEYDDGEADSRRFIYENQSEMETSTAQWGYIVDYNSSFTPVVGVAKPKNIRLLNKGTGFNPDTDIIISRGRTGTTQPYNSTFGFTYFNPVFFTRLQVEREIEAQTFTNGKYIYGKESKAYGVIENDTTGNFSGVSTLFVTTLSGQFIPGETIIDEENNAIKIAKENTISHFIVNNRGSSYNDTSQIVINGTVFDKSKIDVMNYGGSIVKVYVKNRSAVQNTYSTPPSISFDTETDDQVNKAVVTPVLFRNTVLTYNPQNVKSFSSTFNNYKFTADVDLSSTSYATYSQVSDFTFFGSKGRKFLECNGFGADLSGSLIQGDIIQFTDAENNVVKSIVQYVTSPEGIDKSRIYLEYGLPNDVSNATIIRLRPRISNASATLVFPTGSKQVASLVNDTSDTKFKYHVRKDFVTDMSASGGNLTFTAQLPVGTQKFVSFTEENFLITVLDPGSSNVVNSGDIVYIDSRYIELEASVVSANEVSAGAFRIKDLPSSYFGIISDGNYPKLKLTATVEISQARPRLKTAIRNKRLIVISSGDRVIPFRGQDYDSDVIQTYSYSDVFKLKYVYEGTTSNPPSVDSAGNLVSGTDVTYKYNFDDGQRDTYYDVSRIVLKPGFDAPTGQLVIAFDYFEHSAGDFCTVDSYLHEAGVLAEEIPLFNSSVNGVISLRDCIDFRPKVDGNTTITGFQDVSIVSLFDNTDYITFIGEGGIPTLTPAPDSNLPYTASFSEKQYLDRIDGLFLTKKGDFILKAGNSSLNPSKPEPVDDAVALCYLHIPAFTKSSKDVRIVPVDNRRYTMRDIGKLEKRIERLEYYTSLSILEQQALNMQIKDNVGIDKFKSGFLVDNFETHKVGNLKSIDYKCAIDTQQSVLRPQSKEDSFVLKEINTRDDQRVVSGYVINDGVVTLPFESVELLGNKNATKTINPNPFVVIQYVGESVITPQQDSWYDQSVAPLVTDSNTKMNSIFLAKANSLSDAYSSIYNSFVINWVGSDQSFGNIESFAGINTEDVEGTVQSASISSSSNVSPQNNEVGKGISTKTVGGKKIATSLQFFARSTPIKFVINRLKPNTKVYVFMEGRDINAWAAPDTRFTGVATNTLSTFGSPLVTDSNGNLSGLILVPAGLPPVPNTRWTGDVDTVSYDEGKEEIRFTTGVKTIRFTSSSTNEDKNGVDSYAEVKFYATGALPNNPPSITSTSASFFKANEGVQLTDSNTDNPVKPNPLAQTFKIENFDGGVFTTGVDLFFAQKSDNIPLRAYLTDVSAGKPGKNIIPGTQTSLTPETYLRVYVTGESESITLYKNELVTGYNSNAAGPIYKVFDGNNVRVGDDTSDSFQLNKEQVYTLVLNNHNGTSFVPNEPLTIPSITNYNNTNNTTVGVFIAKDSGKVSDLRIANVGDNYESALMTIESPQLPGGSSATGSIFVSDGKIYNVEVALSGRGYTEAPSVVIKGVGTGAAGAVVESTIEIDTPAVRMGIATDVAGVTESTTPTRFNFRYPVYLQNNTEYALVVETDSIEYSLWASQLGEIEISTSNVVTTQPGLGSVYKSQNTDNWTEDLYEDIKFVLYRAEFNTEKEANLEITNVELDYESLDVSPFETSVRSSTNSTSSLFKNNNSIVKVYHRDNGFEDKGNSYVYFKSASDVGGISSVILNNRLFEVSNGGVDVYNILSPNGAGSSVIGGGSKVLATYNRKYERLYAQIPYLQLEGTKIDSFVYTTNVVPVDSNTKNYSSYSTVDYEKTFLNEEHFFTNQKVIASKINHVMNGLTNSLKYKLRLSSSNSALSPVVDLRTATVKTASNRVENATGYENRYGKRDQILTFLPLFELNLSVGGSNAGELIVNRTLVGQTSKAEGFITKYENGDAVIRLRTATPFQQGEPLLLYDEGGNEVESISITLTAIANIEFNFSKGSNVVAYYPQDTDVNYSNRINGKVILWDAEDKILIIENSYTPINSNYTATIDSDEIYSRKSVSSEQQPDIFRVGDVVLSTGDDDPIFVEVASMDYTQGVDYVAETDASNSSSLAKYVTKEVGINNPGTSIDVRATVNLTDVENIKIFYKIREASSSVNFEDANWIPFNKDGNPDFANLATPTNSISGQFEKQDDYQELQFSAADLPEFTSFAVKIIMKTDNPAYVPKVQDIRAVASF